MEEAKKQIIDDKKLSTKEIASGVSEKLKASSMILSNSSEPLQNSQLKEVEMEIITKPSEEDYRNLAEDKLSNMIKFGNKDLMFFFLNEIIKNKITIYEVVDAVIDKKIKKDNPPRDKIEILKNNVEMYVRHKIRRFKSLQLIKTIPYATSISGMRSSTRIRARIQLLEPDMIKYMIEKLQKEIEQNGN